MHYTLQKETFQTEIVQISLANNLFERDNFLTVC